MAVDDKNTTEDMGVADGDSSVGEDRVGEGGVDLDDDAIVESDAPADELVDYHDSDDHNAIVEFIDSTKGKVIMGTAVAVVLLGGFFAINHFGEGDAPEEGVGEIAAPASLSPDQIAERGAMSGRETERSNLNTTTASRSADVTTPTSSSRRGVAEGRNETPSNREPTPSGQEPETQLRSSGTVPQKPVPVPQQPALTPAPTPAQQQPQPQPAPTVTTVYQTPDRDR